ncbi:F-box only protein 8 isoform X2 [Bubalus kerabau]|uniref:F-box only protein 8 isoform X2 n=1 Tax=Bubalus carabanensis TaxID=3119969 RepID=UPI00244E9936|nr:F-box only protein 8 isoform X2 [Bubalus carabanensis]
MGQGLWRVARNQQLQQEGYGEQGYLSREQSRRVAANTMSHTSHRKHVQGGIDIYHLLKTRKSKEQEGFINLEMLPPELSFTILSYLNATDLCLASCVWQDLANDELLWQGLCKSTWGHCSIYNKNPPLGFSFRKLYMQLDEGSLTFNANPDEGPRRRESYIVTSAFKEAKQYRALYCNRQHRTVPISVPVILTSLLSVFWRLTSTNSTRSLSAETANGIKNHLRSLYICCNIYERGLSPFELRCVGPFLCLRILASS